VGRVRHGVTRISWIWASCIVLVAASAYGASSERDYLLLTEELSDKYAERIVSSEFLMYVIAFPNSRNEPFEFMVS
jgi:hypothetical protein